jgi:hypothetical protein
LEPIFVELIDDERQYGYFERGNASVHLQEVFDHRIISTRLWPPREPDFITFICGGNTPCTAGALQNEMKEAFIVIPWLSENVKKEVVPKYLL